jgi:hypothetical protein
MKELNLLDVVEEACVYAVDDVLPYCKPKTEAFQGYF